MLESAREAAIAMRRLEEQIEIKRQSIGVQGHNSFQIHAKSGVMDPMRHVVEYMDWQTELVGIEDLQAPINEAWEIMGGIRHISDGLMVEVVTRYYIEGETWRDIIDGYIENGERMPPISERADLLKNVPRSKQFKWCREATDKAIEQWERIGIAHLKEMGAND